MQSDAAGMSPHTPHAARQPSLHSSLSQSSLTNHIGHAHCTTEGGGWGGDQHRVQPAVSLVQHTRPLINVVSLASSIEVHYGSELGNDADVVKEAKASATIVLL